MDDFIKAITETPAADQLIMVQFKHYPQPEPFTKAVLELLRSDPAVEFIADAETGEALYINMSA